ncbi:helix-turn-helix domain-containing protein [Arthrobacter rhombi]|uniref:helix-turn-helix domain-containing protein n=1 Tax=Micrococcales TaxID=85006 RepID=UPI003FD5F8BB
MDGSQKWKILRLHVEDGIPLASLARETGVGERTLSRWHSLYQTGGRSQPVNAPPAYSVRSSCRRCHVCGSETQRCRPRILEG